VFMYDRRTRALLPYRLHEWYNDVKTDRGKRQYRQVYSATYSDRKDEAERARSKHGN
jgi:hypothetical protein